MTSDVRYRSTSVKQSNDDWRILVRLPVDRPVALKHIGIIFQKLNATTRVLTGCVAGHTKNYVCMTISEWAFCITYIRSLFDCGLLQDRES
jgi:hypothetical protein